MEQAKRMAVRASICGLLVASLIACSQTSPGPTAPIVEDRAPNVLIVITDDQRARTVRAMPRTREFFRDQGIAFRHAFATTPVCCPSRASIMSGRFAHNHGVRYFEPYKLDQASTLQARLKNEDYRTAFFGKYLNAWAIEDDPPHFDRWAIFPQATRATYNGGTWNVDGTITEVTDYSTGFLTAQATSFLEQTETIDTQPWLMFLSTPAAHLPYVVEPKHRRAPVSRWPRNPAVSDDTSDKPIWVRDGSNKSCDLACGQKTQRKQERALLSVDDMVASLFDTLEQRGEADNTLAFFLSDNGLLWGEFGLTGKRFPYRGTVEIPMLMRWPARLQPGTDDRLVGTIDIVPTILDATGTDPSLSFPLDGRSLLDQSWSRKGILLEQWGGHMPTWASLRRLGMQYIEYYGGNTKVVERELYDLERDPWQLHNLLSPASAGRPGRDRWSLSRLHKRLAELRGCEGRSCRP